MPPVWSHRFCLINAADNSVIVGRDHNAQFAQASTTKFTTIAVALAHIVDIDTEAKTLTSGHRSSGGSSSGGSMSPYAVGDRVTMRNAFYGLLYPSGNDMAYLIADYVGGTYLGGNGSQSDNVSKFVAAMNALAVAQGWTNSHYAVPDGINTTGHYSSAYDLAKIGAYVAATYPVVLTICSAVSRRLTTTNNSNTYNTHFGHNGPGWLPGFLAGKGGSTPTTLANISVVERGGVRLATGVIADCLSSPATVEAAVPLIGSRTMDYWGLYDFGFKTLGVTTAVTAAIQSHHLQSQVYPAPPERGGTDPSWATVYAPGTYSDGYAWTSSTSGTVAFTRVYCSAIDFVSRKGPDQGVCQIVLDGITVNASLDLSNGTYINQAVVYSKTFPEPGWHELAIVVTSGTITVDKYVITASAVPETDPMLDISPNRVVEEGTATISGSNLSIALTGATLAATFLGNGTANSTTFSAGGAVNGAPVPCQVYKKSAPGTYIAATLSYNSTGPVVTCVAADVAGGSSGPGALPSGLHGSTVVVAPIWSGDDAAASRAAVRTFASGWLWSSVSNAASVTLECPSELYISRKTKEYASATFTFGSTLVDSVGTPWSIPAGVHTGWYGYARDDGTIFFEKYTGTGTGAAPVRDWALGGRWKHPTLGAAAIRVVGFMTHLGGAVREFHTIARGNQRECMFTEPWMGGVSNGQGTAGVWQSVQIFVPWALPSYDTFSASCRVSNTSSGTLFSKAEWSVDSGSTTCHYSQTTYTTTNGANMQYVREFPYLGTFHVRTTGTSTATCDMVAWTFTI